jgi:hypothetical protein
MLPMAAAAMRARPTTMRMMRSMPPTFLVM